MFRLNESGSSACATSSLQFSLSWRGRFYAIGFYLAFDWLGILRIKLRSFDSHLVPADNPPPRRRISNELPPHRR